MEFSRRKHGFKRLSERTSRGTRAARRVRAKLRPHLQHLDAILRSMFVDPLPFGVYEDGVWYPYHGGWW